MIPFATATITRLRFPLVDDGHGNMAADTHATPVSLTVPGCNVQPGASAEVLENRQAVLIAWTVLAPAGVDVLASDCVEYDGKRYAVDGEPLAWDSPTGRLAHTVLLLTRWEG